MTFSIRLIQFLSFGPLFLPSIYAQTSAKQHYEQEFQRALGQYQSHQLDESASTLESLVRELPGSFDVHELLGMVYSAEGRKEEANDHLEKAARLNPNSAAARTNLATNLVQLQKLALAEVQFKRALALDPASYDTNHNLGEFYVRDGKIPFAVSFLERAQRIKPNAYDNGYDLALACMETNRNAEAEHVVTTLLRKKDAVELHSLLAEIEEKDGNFVAAEHEYELAAHADPSESNLFDWASELLLHRTLDAAVEIFTKGVQRYPQSQRLAIGLGMAYYSRGNYDDAVKILLVAANLNPSDPRCYYFLSKAYDSSPAQADEVTQTFRRFAELQPQNSRALYYYAMSLWKGRRAEDATLDFSQVETLLKKSAGLDVKFAEPRLQLGNLYSDQKKYSDAVPEYVQALGLNPDLGDAHYRLGQAYMRLGKRDEAQQQLQTYQKIRAEHMAELDKQRAEVRQFVISEKGSAPNDNGGAQP